MYDIETGSQEGKRNPYLPEVKFEAIRICDLVCNQQYQRKLSRRNVRRAAKNYDPCQVNPVKVSRRDGVNYVMNGQHTIEIIAEVSGSRETPVWCMVYENLGYQREANIFANQQKYVKTLTSYEIFNASLEAGDDQALMIRDLVKSYHLEIGPANLDQTICAVGALTTIYSQDGLDVLNRTLRLLVRTWEGSRLSLGASVLKGTARVITTYGAELKDELFIEKLSAVSIKEIIRNARDWSGGPLGVAQALVVAYNRKLKSPLSMERLFAKKTKEVREEDAESNPSMELAGVTQQAASALMEYKDTAEPAASLESMRLTAAEEVEAVGFSTYPKEVDTREHLESEEYSMNQGPVNHVEHGGQTGMSSDDGTTFA